MGWTGSQKGVGISIADYLRAETNCCNDKASHEVIDIVVKGCSAAYAAVRYTNNETGQSYVYGLVYALRYDRKNDYLCYKDMDETMGPFFYDCPEHILNLLTPTKNEEAKSWRDKCRAVLAQRESLKQELSAAKEGTIFKFGEPVEFTRGGRHQYMTYHHREGRKLVFTVGPYAMYASFEKLVEMKKRYGLEVKGL